MNDISIPSTLTTSDVAYIKGILTSNGIDQEKFEQMLQEISKESKKLEENYQPHKNLFPEHNFNRIATGKVLENTQDQQISSISETSNETSEVTKVENKSEKDNVTTLSKNVEEKVVETPKEVKTETAFPSLAKANNNQYDSLISKMSNKYNVPFDLVKSVIYAESTFNPSATSRTGAMGLMQLMPATAKWLGVKNAYDPAQNIEGGTKYLSYLIDKFDNNLKLAVAAYNAGPGNVNKYKGIPPFQETQNYVKKILG